MRPDPGCIMCGSPFEPRDADEMVMRCPDVPIERSEPVYLRDLGEA